jgi:cytidylate kinase
LAAHKLGNIVIVGRGGQSVLRGSPGVLHVRIEAPPDARIQRVVSQTGASRAEAEKQIHEHDKASAGYVKRFYDVDWSDAALYHLVVNAGLWGVDRATQVVADAVRVLPEA